MRKLANGEVPPKKKLSKVGTKVGEPDVSSAVQKLLKIQEQMDRERGKRKKKMIRDVIVESGDDNGMDIDESGVNDDSEGSGADDIGESDDEMEDEDSLEVNESLDDSNDNEMSELLDDSVNKGLRQLLSVLFAFGITIEKTYL